MISPLKVGCATVHFATATPEEKNFQRDQILDQLHASLENDPYPDDPVTLSACPRSGGRLDVHLPSLTDRRRAHPSSAERRRLLGIQLSAYLAVLGV